MDLELAQCLAALPPLVAQMKEYRGVSVCDLNLVEWFIMGIEQFLEFLHVLMGKDTLAVQIMQVKLTSVYVCSLVPIGKMWTARCMTISYFWQELYWCVCVCVCLHICILNLCVCICWGGSLVPRSFEGRRKGLVHTIHAPSMCQPFLLNSP